MKKILVICQYFYPEQFRINDICMEWVKRGYDVTVLTGIPNYPQGKFYDGYGIFGRRSEVWNGIKIIRIPLVPRGKSAIGLVLNYISFPISGFFWNIITKIRADYVFMFETSPMNQCKIGVQYAKKHHVPLYLYVQDLWPENVEIVTGVHNPLIIRPIDRMVDQIYQACDEIFVTSPSFVDAVVDRKKRVAKEKVHYWPQYAEDFYKPIDENITQLHRKTPEIPDDSSYKVAFTGNIGYAQGLDTLPKTAELIQDVDVTFVVIGDGRYKEKLLQEVEERHVAGKFCFVDRQPAERIPELLSLCDAAFISFMDTELFAKTIPAKLQSYMACGMPILASARGETKRIIEEADCGFCVDIGDFVTLAHTIRQMAVASDRKMAKKNMGNKARKYFETHFTKQKLMDEFEQYFR